MPLRYVEVPSVVGVNLLVNVQACEGCGRTPEENAVHECGFAGGRWLCQVCVGPYLGRESTSGTATPIEPFLEPTFPSEPNGSMGPRDGSVGVDKTARRAKALGIAAPLGESFPCILPGHDDTARLHPTAKGFWHYRCEGDDKRELGLAEVRAALAYGEVRRISRTEAARWRERLDHEAGVLAFREVPIALNPRASDATRHVANGLRLFLGLRDARWGEQPFTWAREFVMAYCNVTDQQARDAVRTLEHEHKAIERTGEKNGRAIVWRLGGSSTCKPEG